MEHYSNDCEGVSSQNWKESQTINDPWEQVNNWTSQLPTVYPTSLQQTNRQDERINENVKYLLYKFRYSKSIRIFKRGCCENVIFDPKRGIRCKPETIRYTLIGKTKQGRMLLLLCRVSIAKRFKKFIKLRHVFYKEKVPFETQKISNNLINDLCCIMRCTRSQLNIKSKSKGLVYGNLQFRLNGTRHNCHDLDSGLSIKHDFDQMKEITSDARFILIVEKDATFQDLIEDNITDMIMITGSGMPDWNTRRLVNFLYNKLQLPIFYLGDADPHGLEIMCTYRYGSLCMAHDVEILAAPALRWIGLWPSNIEKLATNTFNTEKLTKSDLKKISSLKKRLCKLGNIEWARQLAIMKKINLKAGLQSIENPVEIFLPGVLRNGLWI